MKIICVIVSQHVERHTNIRMNEPHMYDSSKVPTFHVGPQNNNYKYDRLCHGFLKPSKASVSFEHLINVIFFLSFPDSLYYNS